MGEAVPALSRATRFGVGIEVAKQCVGNSITCRISQPKWSRGCVEDKSAINGRYVVLILPAPHDQDSSLEVMAAHDL